MDQRLSEPEEQLSREIRRLPDLTIEELKVRWRSLYDCAPPGRCSKKLLVAAIAYRMQERAFGGLKTAGLPQLELSPDDAGASRDSRSRPVTKATTGTV